MTEKCPFGNGDLSPTQRKLNEDTMKRAETFIPTCTRHTRRSIPSNFQNLERSRTLDPSHTSQPPTHPQHKQLSWQLRRLTFLWKNLVYSCQVHPHPSRFHLPFAVHLKPQPVPLCHSEGPIHKDPNVNDAPWVVQNGNSNPSLSI